MDENLKTTIDYIPVGKKKAKQYDATVVEAVKGKHIMLEVADVSSFPIKLIWDKTLYSAITFGNKITCEYTIVRDFTATKVVTNRAGTRKSDVARRSKSGRPNSMKNQYKQV